MRQKQYGVSLIEVLVSIIVLAIGMLGVAALQSLALRGGQSSLETSQAVIQANSLSEAMRANRANLAAYNTARTCAVPAAGATLASRDISSWVQNLKDTIGGGGTTCATVTGCPVNCVITVEWDDQRAGGASNRQLSMRAGL